MKKKLLVLGLCVALAAIAIAGASLAYFTDTKSATNTFTVGNVKIDLIESRYHREGNDNSGDTSIPDPTQTASGMKYVTDGKRIRCGLRIGEVRKRCAGDRNRGKSYAEAEHEKFLSHFL